MKKPTLIVMVVLSAMVVSAMVENPILSTYNFPYHASYSTEGLKVQTETALKTIQKISKNNPGGQSSHLVDVTLVLKGLMTGQIKPATVIPEKTASIPELMEQVDKETLLLIIGGKPTPRKEGEPYIRIDQKSESAMYLAPFINYMETVGSLMDSVTTSKMYPFILSSFSPSDYKNPALQYLVAVYDLGTGMVYLNEKLIEPLKDAPINEISGAYNKLISHFQVLVQKSTQVEDPIDLFKLLQFSVSSLFSSGVWLCILCVFALSQIFPLIANYVLIELALYLCQVLQLTETTCQSLWTSAVGLAFMLLPVMAYGIFILCNVQHCASTLL